MIDLYSSTWEIIIYSTKIVNKDIKNSILEGRISLESANLLNNKGVVSLLFEHFIIDINHTLIRYALPGSVHVFLSINQ